MNAMPLWTWDGATGHFAPSCEVEWRALDWTAVFARPAGDTLCGLVPPADAQLARTGHAWTVAQEMWSEVEICVDCRQKVIDSMRSKVGS